MNLMKTVEKSAKKAVSLENVARAGGFAVTGLAERTVFTQFRGIFGNNGAEGGLNMTQQVARGAYRVAQGVAGGTLMLQKQPIVKATGQGVAAGSIWHLANQFGINF